MFSHAYYIVTEMKPFVILKALIICLLFFSFDIKALPDISIEFTGQNSGGNTQPVQFTVTVDDYNASVFLAVGVSMPVKENAPSILIKNNALISTLGVYRFNSADIQDKGSAWTFFLDPKVLPVTTGGSVIVIGGYADEGYIVTDLTIASQSWARYSYIIPDRTALGNLPEITAPATGLTNLSRTVSTPLIYDAGNMAEGDYFYCRIVPAGVPLNNDRLPDISVTSTPYTEINNTYTGSTFRVRYTGSGSTILAINPNLRDRIQSYMDDGKTQSYKYSDGFILQIIAVNAYGVSANQIVYFSWEKAASGYEVYVAQTSTGGNYVSGGSVNYLVDYDASFYGTGYSNTTDTRRIYLSLSPITGTNTAGALSLEENIYTMSPSGLYYLDYSYNTSQYQQGSASFNLAHLLMESKQITFYVRAGYVSGTGTGVLPGNSIQQIYTFSSEVINVDVRRPNNLIGTGTLTEQPVNGAYGWYVEQNGYLVNTIDVNRPFVIYFGTNYVANGGSWDGETLPRLLIRDVANNAWSEWSPTPLSMAFTNNGSTVPGLFANSNYSNYYTLAINDYYKTLSIDPANYISGGTIEIKIGSANNTPEITRPGTALNTFTLYGSNQSNLSLNTVLNPGSNKGMYIFSGMPGDLTPADVTFRVSPSYTRIGGIQENSRIYFVLSDNGIIDLKHAIPYNPEDILDEDVTYYVPDKTTINFDKFLTGNNSELIIRTRAVIGNYQEADPLKVIDIGDVFSGIDNNYEEPILNDNGTGGGEWGEEEVPVRDGVTFITMLMLFYLFFRLIKKRKNFFLR